jgi:nucleoside-diphosphate-sugar epimerase
VGSSAGHLVKRLKAEGCRVRVVGLKRHDFAQPPADEFIVGDLRDPWLLLAGAVWAAASIIGLW